MSTLKEAYQRKQAMRMKCPENLKKREKWLSHIRQHADGKHLVDLRMIFSDYSQQPFTTYGEAFRCPDLEKTVATLINGDFKKLPEVVYFDEKNVIWVHPEIAICYIELLTKGEGWHFIPIQ